MDPARTTDACTPGALLDSPGGGPAADAETVFDVVLPPTSRPAASVVSAPSVSSSAPVPAGADPARPVASLSSASARVVPAGAGVHRLVFVPCPATAAEVAAVAAAAVFMGGSVGTDKAEFVEFDGPAPWPGPLGGGSVILGATGSGKVEFAAEVPAAPGRHLGQGGASRGPAGSPMNSPRRAGAL